MTTSGTMENWLSFREFHYSNTMLKNVLWIFHCCSFHILIGLQSDILSMLFDSKWTKEVAILLHFDLLLWLQIIYRVVTRFLLHSSRIKCFTIFLISFIIFLMYATWFILFFFTWIISACWKPSWWMNFSK